MIELLRDEKKTAWVIFGSVTLLFSAVLCFQQLSHSGNLVASDGVGYFSHLPNFLFDRNLDYQDEFGHFGVSRRNHWSFGTALLWLPFYLIGHIWSLVSSLLYPGAITSGVGYPEQLACCLGTIALGSAALAVSYRLACRWLEPIPALVGSVMFFGGSNLPYYMLAEPYMSHGASAFTVSLLLFYGLRDEELTVQYALRLGFLGGLAAVVRPQDGLFLALPLLYHFKPRFQFLRTVMLAGIISALLFSFQVVIWTGQPKKMNPPVGEASLTVVVSEDSVSPVPGGSYLWFKPRLSAALYQSKNGLFLWHPAFFLGLAGLFALKGSGRNAGRLLALGFLFQLYIIGVWGYQGQSFGGRMFLGCFASMCVGCGAVYQSLSRRNATFLFFAQVGLVIWNIFLMLRYRQSFQNLESIWTLMGSS